MIHAPQQRELNFADYLRLILKNKYILLLSVASFLGPTWWLVKRTPDYYTASSQIVMDEEKTNANMLLLEQQTSSRNLGYYRAIFQSQAFLDKLVGALAMVFEKEGIREDPRRFITEKLGLGEGSVESFISVSARTSSPTLTFALVKIATDSLIVHCRKVANEEGEKAIEAIKEQIEICVRKRDEIQLEKSRLSDVSKLATLGDYAGLSALEKSYQEELVKFELDKANLAAKKSYYQSLDAQVNKPARGADDAEAASLRERMRSLEREKEKLMRLGIAVTPDSKLTKDIQETEGKLAKMSRPAETQDISTLNQWQAIRKEVNAGEAEMQLKKARLDAFKKAIVAYKESHPDLGKHEFEVAQLDALLERYTNNHKRLAERLEDAIISMQSKSGGLKLVDAAQLPTEPIPRRDYVFYLVSLAAGLAFGIGLGLLREFMDDTIKTPDDIEKQLAQTLLGTIPHIVPKKSDLEVKRSISRGKKAQIRNKYPELVLGPMGEESVVAEAYRSLRTNIVFSSPDKPVQTLLITSSGPGEGKSLTMANTALSFAQQGEPTLIIDADLRRPVVHHLFAFDRGPGFGELFAGTSTLDEVTREVPGTNLRVITAGAFMPNPAELLGSKKMDAFLGELKERFRYILFDTPPIIAVTDATILGTKVDGVVLCVRADKTSLTVGRRTLQTLRNVNARVLGCILNDVDLTKGYSSYGYYKHYYHYYQTKKD
ncbi:MAG TPA: polysaccharide biosynthesis tyrosine autokinase [Fibrobacteria bacterium]|nr:polysaccharide biosynthesis tyrosine autokinase [Fibrobacteria bacterium]